MARNVAASLGQGTAQPYKHRDLGFLVLSAQESLVLRMYASGATLQATARRAGVAYGTARAGPPSRYGLS